jgi:hypothetical protein
MLKNFRSHTIVFKSYFGSTSRGTVYEEAQILSEAAIQLLRRGTQLQEQFGQFLEQTEQTCTVALQTDHVRIGPSTVCDGKGLFATEALKRGQFLGFYPLHAVGAVGRNGTHRWTWLGDRSHFDAAARDPSLHHFGQNLNHPSLRWPGQIFIDVNPHRPLIPGWLGHIINDCNVCLNGDHNELRRYFSVCLERVNCFCVPLGPPPVMAYVTSAPVAKGDELLTSYFPAFWLPQRYLITTHTLLLEHTLGWTCHAAGRRCNGSEPVLRLPKLTRYT